jgi:hypothetical protein
MREEVFMRAPGSGWTLIRRSHLSRVPIPGKFGAKSLNLPLQTNRTPRKLSPARFLFDAPQKPSHISED